MNATISTNVLLENHSGGVLSLDRDANQIDVVFADGTPVAFSSAEFGDAFGGDRIVFHHFDDCCVIVGESGTTAVLVGFRAARIEHLCDIERTALMEEGFDYCVFFDFGERVVLSYEFGLIGFDRSGKIVWRHEFSDVRVYPRSVNGEICFCENERDYRFSILDGNMKP